MYERYHNRVAVFAIITAVILAVFFAVVAIDCRAKAELSPSPKLSGWRTNTSKSLINIEELSPGGSAKDEIPAITKPKFETPFMAMKWLPDREPVISVVVGKTAKAYPLQVLIWHEIINDTIEGISIAVTFCPLSYSAAVYKRTINGRPLTFGVSGMLRNSCMVMYDRQTETLWQQFDGIALMGDMAGRQLECLPSQIISFGQFTAANRKGAVLTQETGFERSYGENPYVGYDDASSLPIMFKGGVNASLAPMEKVVAVKVNDRAVAYPGFVTASKGAINDEICDVPIVVFHTDGAVSAMDRQSIRNSRQVGSTGVFSRMLGKHRLTFAHDGTYFIDLQTRSTWTVAGIAIEGPLTGEKLVAMEHKSCFAFAWLVFNPDTQIYR